MNTTAIILECQRQGIKLAVDRARNKLLFKSAKPIPTNLLAELKRNGKWIVAIHNVAHPIDWAQRAAGMFAGIVDPEERAGLRERFEERAAMLEDDRHLPRDEAERLAFEQVLGKAEVAR